MMSPPEHLSPIPHCEVTTLMLRRLSPILGVLALLSALVQPAAATSIGAVVNASNDDFTSNEITIFESLGLAIEDLAAVNHIYRRAEETGKGTRVELGGERH